MFNANFFPTPANLISRMLAPLNLEHDAYILEPSAGKGDILDALETRGHRNLYAIEIEPELQAILRDKGYSIVACDFLKYTPNIRFTHIIMNPPFADAEKHLLHAWEILYEGEIVAVMPKVALQAKDRYEQAIARLVQDHGEVEDSGRAFANAERKTSAEIVIVRLHKQAHGEKMEWDVRNDRVDPDFGASVQKEIALRGFIANLLSNFNAAVGNYAAYNQARQNIVQYIKLFEGFYDGNKSHDIMKESDSKDTPQSRYNRFIDLIQASAWSKILDHPQFQAILTERARKMMRDFRQQQRRMDFNEANIRSMFEALLAKQTELLDGAILDAFDTMTEYHAENRIYFEGWKTNKAWRVNYKVILPYATRLDFAGYPQPNYSRRDELMDIDRALCVVSGMKFEKVRTIWETIEESGRAKMNWGVSTFFYCKFYKKGTLHLRFKDMELWKEFNYRAAKARNWLPPGEPAPARQPRAANKRTPTAQHLSVPQLELTGV